MKYRLYFKRHYSLSSYTYDEAVAAKERMIKAGYKDEQIKIIKEEDIFN